MSPDFQQSGTLSPNPGKLPPVTPAPPDVSSFGSPSFVTVLGKTFSTEIPSLDFFSIYVFLRIRGNWILARILE